MGLLAPGKHAKNPGRNKDSGNMEIRFRKKSRPASRIYTLEISKFLVFCKKVLEFDKAHRITYVMSGQERLILVQHILY